MASRTVKQDPITLFHVRGRVFDAITQQGIGGLLVTVYAMLKNTERSAGTLLDALLKNAVRIGSVSSTDEGQFEFQYDSEDILTVSAQKKRLDLMLVVSAADNESDSSLEKIFYYTNPPRQNAGRNESFNISISRDTQKKFSLRGNKNIKDAVADIRLQHADRIELNDGVIELNKRVMQEDIAKKSILREQLLEKIAATSSAIENTGALVRGNESVKEKVSVVSNRAVEKANHSVSKNRGVPLNLFLTDDDRDRLGNFFAQAQDGYATIPEFALGDALSRKNSTENPGTLLIHNNPIAMFCMQSSTEEKCAEAHTGVTEGHDGDHEHTPPDEHTHGPTDIEPASNADIPKYLASLIGKTPSPDNVLSSAFNQQRADRATVETSIDAFSLRKGPAEVPAFYDFNSLQIAFEHVWKVLLDEQIVDSAYSLDKNYQIKTGLSLSDRFSGALSAALNGNLIYQSIPQEVPADVAANFDITIDEWIDLSVTHRQKLLDLSKEIAAACTPIHVSNFLGDHIITPRRCEVKRQELREQGERIIDGIRHDDYYTMHKTLRDLHNRINSNYEFTVFAADKNFHSVNFGLLNTYRQQWTPLNYQAGKLVKTIPLSPKEERKYSLKVTQNTKQAKKQALKNNSTIKNEQASTSRVEADIMEKAQNKTNFSLNTEGSYNIGISKGKSTTTFGVEAQNESASNRKDFREAVLKASQEYAEERIVQIDTEESSSYEYTESGTIVNPNDELSVTYLFYELQRRYRINEKLYRVLPVVLVAQEMPAPHQITESWLISNDWIINRCLLDDSFRPALAYLANRSVGDDFALRELRRNLRQQRNLVETLRLEFTAVSDEAQNRYRALESSISKRISEESAENTDGFFSDAWDFFGGGGPDPEAAKARELAAKDAHQYAVEKAEKAATALRQEVNNLHTLTREYNGTLREHLDNETRVKRLLVHIRNNISYYMQMIWSMEPPDQRFLRLHKVQVPKIEFATIPDPANPGIEIPDRSYRVRTQASEDIFERFRTPGTTKHSSFMTGRIKPVTEYMPLVEAADISDLLGFMGNYMIFPMKEHNAITEFMSAPYVDAAFGAMDPDELTNVSLNDYSRYVCCLHEQMSEDEFNAIKPQLKKWLQLLLADPLRNGDEIVVPTSSLFIEALPGTHPLLENFKLRHRELDVYKVQAEVRKIELENLRLAARLLNNERDDPDVEKKIVIEGELTPHIDPDNP